MMQTTVAAWRIEHWRREQRNIGGFVFTNNGTILEKVMVSQEKKKIIDKWGLRKSNCHGTQSSREDGKRMICNKEQKACLP